MKAEYFPPKVDIILQNEIPTDLYILVSGAVVYHLSLSHSLSLSLSLSLVFLHSHSMQSHIQNPNCI